MFTSCVCVVIQIVGGIFTHHQKCVIVDTQAPGNNRKVTSFIGGLDLCDGRYDTPKHRLFQDIDTVYQGDFHNPTYAVSCPILIIKITTYFFSNKLLNI